MQRYQEWRINCRCQSWLTLATCFCCNILFLRPSMVPSSDRGLVGLGAPEGVASKSCGEACLCILKGWTAGPGVPDIFFFFL
ncbi:hypothetical protein BDZ91DRAFT_747422, partial [Kalaharituber pfeilii]